MKLNFLCTVLGVVLVVEGIPWFLSPRGAKRMLNQMFQLDEATLRGLGLVLMLSGLLVVYLAK